MSENKNARVELTEPVKWFAFKDQYFSSVIIGAQPFSNTILDTKVLSDTAYLKGVQGRDMGAGDPQQ